jgi:HD-GYP domain-containing protein (c-di-GMP phosphodiesterase class II)
MDGKHVIRQFFDQTTWLIQRFRANYEGFLKSPSTPFLQEIRTIPSELQTLCHQDPDALLATLQLDDTTPYHVSQPIHTAVIGELLAFHAGVPPEERLSLIAGALTHDIGMGGLHEALQHQLVPLSETQRQHLQRHPAHGADALAELGITDPIWLDTVRHHHERQDGSGYPDRLKGDAISLHSRILSIADMYSAMIKPKAYRQAKPPTNALRDLFVARNAQTDNELTQLFIKLMGIYPPGMVMRLHNGEIAIVTHRGQNTATPVVQAFCGPRGAPLETPIVRDIKRDAYGVREVIYHGNYVEALHDARINLWDPHKRPRLKR